MHLLVVSSPLNRLLSGLLLFVVLLLAFAQGACRKEKFTTDPADKLEFSTDTLRFDTVFTQLGSATRILKVYNRHRESIRISRIYLENGGASRFNLNIDGIAGDDQRDIEIAPQDSLYVFAEVTIDPNDQNSPFVLNERIVLETNGNTQHVVLEAWGQNAIYLPSRFGAGGAVGYGCGGGEWVWNDPKPYVIYGILVIDSCTVRIPAGARVYVHGGLGRLVDTNGSVVRYNDGYIAFRGVGRLIVEGTRDNPVIFEGDRLEPEFDDEPGQWVGLWLQSGTTGHRVEHCIIRNSILGIRADSAAELTLRNTQIYNTTSPALIGLHATMDVANCLFYDNGGYCIQLEWGGDYQFDYCTAASVGVDGDALRMTNVLCADQQCIGYSLYPLKAHFRNCIFYGSRADQITLFDRENNPQNFDYDFKNCLVRVKDLLKANQYPDFFEHCNPCRNVDSRDTIFLDVNKDNYRLDTLHSAANKYGLPIPGLERDLEEKLRDAMRPDAGCYEIEF